MTATLPFLTSYDPIGTGEGSLDPLGLYQIADQLAVQLVPAVRERMQRIRFLTAITLGSLVTEEIEDNPQNRDSSPSLVWEWLVVEAIVRACGDGDTPLGVPGTSVTRRALSQHGYLDARSYLKTPAVFGFNGVYKRLAVHLGLVDVHLRPGPNAEALLNAWVRGLDESVRSGYRSLLARWKTFVTRSTEAKPPRTRSQVGWTGNDWEMLAAVLDPTKAKVVERRCIKELLLGPNGRAQGAFPAIWALQERIPDEAYVEEALHKTLGQQAPQFKPLLDAIKGYERFARGLKDAFDLLLANASSNDLRGFVITDVSRDTSFSKCVKGLDRHFGTAHGLLGEVGPIGSMMQHLFRERFGAFAEELDAGSCALTLCTHHEAIQRGKSATGKRAWFERTGPNQIYVRQDYRAEKPEPQPGRYVHSYRSGPIRRFWRDLQ
jgi:hypothetical protein